jgi:hypothetical protein
MSNYENVTTTKNYPTISDVVNKKNRTIKQLEKELERRNRSPSNRLGKNAKKEASRRNLVLNEEEHNEEPNEEPFIENIIAGSIKPQRIPLGRLKRKPSHRERGDEIKF